MSRIYVCVDVAAGRVNAVDISCSEARLPSEYFAPGKSIPRFSETQTQFQMNSSSTSLPSSDEFVQAEVLNVEDFEIQLSTSLPQI